MNIKPYEVNAKSLIEICNESFNETVEGKIIRIDYKQLDGDKWCVIYIVDADDGIVCMASPEYASRSEIKEGQAIQVQGSVQFDTQSSELVLWVNKIKNIPSNIEWQNCHDKMVDEILVHANIDISATKTKIISPKKAFCAVRDYYAASGVTCRHAYFIMLIEALLQRANNSRIIARP